MWRYVLLMVGVAAIAGEAVHLIKKDHENTATAANEVAENTQQVSLAQPQAQEQKPLTGRQARIPMDNHGHFFTNARMNGRSVKVLVDTGATSVAINRSTARRLGIHTVPADFKHKINTANGVTKGAVVEIDRIEIGRISVRKVRALVVQDKSLDGTLLGMSFLGQLRKFEISNQSLLLTQ